jgi:sugar-specific transcriptional regulator TrmB
MDIAILKKLNLSDKEAAVYLKLLQYGAASVRSLAEITGLNRGTAYDILKKLQEIGLVSYYHHETKQRFVAEDPERLLKLAKDKEIELNEVKNKIIELIPELKSLQDKKGEKPTVKFYEAKAGIKLILDDLLSVMEKQKEDEREYYIYSATNASDDINNAYPDFTKKRIRKKIRVKAIALAKGGKTHGFDERRWLGTREESATFIFIYAGKCAFISRDAKAMPIGVIIENKTIYETQKIIFLQLWGLLKREVKGVKNK